METKEILVIVLIGVLLLAVGLQTIQLTKLSKTQVVVPAASGAPVTETSTSGSSLSTNLQELPSMVGGC